MNRHKEKRLRRAHTPEQIVINFRRLFIEKVRIFLFTRKHIALSLLKEKFLHIGWKMLKLKRGVADLFVDKVIYHQRIFLMEIAYNKKCVRRHHPLHLFINCLVDCIKVPQCFRRREHPANLYKRRALFAIPLRFFIQTCPLNDNCRLVSKQLKKRQSLIGWAQSVKRSIRCQKTQKSVIAADERNHQQIFCLPNAVR